MSLIALLTVSKKGTAHQEDAKQCVLAYAQTREGLMHAPIEEAALEI